MPLDDKRKEDLMKQVKYNLSRIENILNGEDGKFLLDHLGETFFENETTIVPGDINATLTRCGAREVILYMRSKQE